MLELNRRALSLLGLTLPASLLLSKPASPQQPTLDLDDGPPHDSWRIKWLDTELGGVGAELTLRSMSGANPVDRTYLFTEDELGSAWEVLFPIDAREPANIIRDQIEKEIKPERKYVDWNIKSEGKYNVEYFKELEEFFADRQVFYIEAFEQEWGNENYVASLLSRGKKIKSSLSESRALQIETDLVYAQQQLEPQAGAARWIIVILRIIRAYIRRRRRERAIKEALRRAERAKAERERQELMRERAELREHIDRARKSAPINDAPMKEIERVMSIA